MYRHENKYTCAPHLRGALESRIRLLPQEVSEVYPPRWVNSLYYDGFSGRRLDETVEGLERRDKLRIRWYGEFWDEVAEPRFEIKSKVGHAGTKESFPLAPFELSRSTSRRALGRLLTSENLPPLLTRAGLGAVVATRYRRRYYASADARLRITLDENVRYLGVAGSRGFAASWRHDPPLVIELKYAVSDRRRAEAAAQELGLRWVRNSKFARGLVFTFSG